MGVGLLLIIIKQIGGLKIVQSFDKLLRQAYTIFTQRGITRALLSATDHHKGENITPCSIQVYLMTNTLLLVGRAFWYLLASL